MDNKSLLLLLWLNGVPLTNCHLYPYLFVGWSTRRKLQYEWNGFTSPLLWCHNGPDGVSNHQPHDCLLNRLSRHRWKKTSKLRVTGFCVGNLPVTGEFPTQMASSAENVFIWWRHHDSCIWDVCSQSILIWCIAVVPLVYLIELTHWDRVTHICVSKLTTIGLDNGLSSAGARPLAEPMLEYC